MKLQWQVTTKRLLRLLGDVTPVPRAGGSTVFGEIHARCSHSAFSLQDVVVETLGEKGELILSKHGVCAGRFEKLFGEPI